MKKEFLKNLGLDDDVISKIIAEHNRIAEMSVIENLVSSSGAKAPEVVMMLIDKSDASSAESQISQLKGDYPWLFMDSCPAFSAHCESEGEAPDPFRYGAGL